MLERKSEKILLLITLALIAALLLQTVVVSPLWSAFSAVGDEISNMENHINQTQKLLDHERDVLHRADLVGRKLRIASEQGQNMFRRYIESEAGLVVVKSSTPKSETDFPERSGFRLITYDLVLEGTVDMIRVFLDKLDRSGELLRIDKIMIANVSMETGTVTVTMTVSTVTQKIGQAENEFVAANNRGSAR